MILCRQHRGHGVPIHKGHQREFLSLQIVFNDHLPTGLAQGVMLQHPAHGVPGFLPRPSNDDPLALGQPVGLHHHGRRAALDVGEGGTNAVKRAGLRRGNPLPHHQVLGKRFTGFDLRGVSGGTEYFQFVPAKQIRNTQRQRRFRSDDREIDGFFLSERFQTGQVGCRERHAGGVPTDACVAGSTIESGHPRTLRQFPHQRVFASATANDQNFHESEPVPVARGLCPVACGDWPLITGSWPLLFSVENAAYRS